MDSIEDCLFLSDDLGHFYDVTLFEVQTNTESLFECVFTTDYVLSPNAHSLSIHYFAFSEFIFTWSL